MVFNWGQIRIFGPLYFGSETSAFAFIQIFDTLDQFLNPDHVSHYFRLNDRRTFTKKVCEAKGVQIRGCQLDNNNLQPFPKWPQFFLI